MSFSTVALQRGRAPANWAIAGLLPAAFVLICAILTLLAAPEHDDFCLGYSTREMGFLPSVANLYASLSGRVAALALIQTPEVIASTLSISILSTYPFVLAVMVAAFILGIVIAIIRGWPAADGSQVFLLAATFAATSIAVAPSAHEMLYWLPGAACYIPPSVVAMIFLAELSRLEQLSPARAACLSILGFAASMCNEFTGIWLLAIAVSSYFARFSFQLRPQLLSHGAIAAPALIGFIIVASAPGNSGRRSVLPNSGRLWESLIKGLLYSIDCLGRLLSKPAVIACLIVVAAVTLTSARALDRRSATRLAALILIVCLACCYFEFFVHEYATGIRLIERAQNQALIFLLFGMCLAISHLVAAWAPAIGFESGSRKVWGLGAIVGLCLVISPTGALLRSEFGSFLAFHREAIERDRALRASAPATSAVELHRSKPSLLMGVDADVGTGCLKMYYGKPDLVIEGLHAPSP